MRMFSKLVVSENAVKRVRCSILAKVKDQVAQAVIRKSFPCRPSTVERQTEVADNLRELMSVIMNAASRPPRIYSCKVSSNNTPGNKPSARKHSFKGIKAKLQKFRRDRGQIVGGAARRI